LDRKPCLGPAVAFVMIAQQSVEKARHRVEGRLGRLPMREMADAGQQGRFNRAEALPPRRLDLADRAVLIVETLDDQDRHADIAKRLGNVPLAKIRIEPRPDPGMERTVNVGVPAHELPAQSAVSEFFARATNLGKAHLLDEEMRTHEHEAAHAVILDAARVNGRDRGAVAVTAENAAL